MSRFQFHNPSSLWFPESLHHCTLVTDFNQKPVPSQMSWTESDLSLKLLEDECGRVHTLVPTTKSTNQQGNSSTDRDAKAILLATPWLFPKLSGYRLEIELLRGLISRLRMATELWQANQLTLPSDFHRDLSDATHQFISFWKTKDFLSIESASLDLLYHLLFLSRKLSDSLLERQGQNPFDRFGSSAPKESGFTLGGRIDLCSLDGDDNGTEDLRASDLHKLDLLTQTPVIDAVAIRQAWRPVPQAIVQSVRTNTGYLESISQKLRQARKRSIIGPIFDISRDAIPSGQSLARDGEDLRLNIVNSIQHTLPNIATETGLIHVVGGINGIGVNGLTPTIQSQLVIDALETANTIAPYTQLMISFDQPYCERHAWSVGGQTPEYFLTKLAKQRTPLHAIGLEINLGYFPRGTLPRTDLDWIMLLHSWVIWEVPIYILLRFPNKFDTAGRSKSLCPIDSHSTELPSTSETAQHLAKLFSAMPWIHGVIFEGLTDEDKNFASPQLENEIDPDFKQLFIK